MYVLVVICFVCCLGFIGFKWCGAPFLLCLCTDNVDRSGVYVCYIRV